MDNRGYSPWAKRRTLEGILHGWSKGKILAIKGATNAHGIMRAQIASTIVDRQMLQTGKTWGLLSNQKYQEWREIEHPNFVDWKWVGQVEISNSHRPERAFVAVEEFLWLFHGGNLPVDGGQHPTTPGVALGVVIERAGGAIMGIEAQKRQQQHQKDHSQLNKSPNDLNAQMPRLMCFHNVYLKSPAGSALRGSPALLEPVAGKSPHTDHSQHTHRERSRERETHRAPA